MRRYKLLFFSLSLTNYYCIHSSAADERQELLFKAWQLRNELTLNLETQYETCERASRRHDFVAPQDNQPFIDAISDGNLPKIPHIHEQQVESCDFFNQYLSVNDPDAERSMPFLGCSILKNQQNLAMQLIKERGVTCDTLTHINCKGRRYRITSLGLALTHNVKPELLRELLIKSAAQDFVSKPESSDDYSSLMSYLTHTLSPENKVVVFNFLSEKYGPTNLLTQALVDPSVSSEDTLGIVSVGILDTLTSDQILAYKKWIVSPTSASGKMKAAFLEKRAGVYREPRSCILM